MPPAETQRVLRELFSQWGRPEQLRVDNGTPWGSWNDLPPDLALWILGLQVGLIWNAPGRPQHNGVVERSQGTGKRWAEPSACRSVAQLQRQINRMDRLQREKYPVAGNLSRRQLWPGLAHSGRTYSRPWEQNRWSLQHVLEHLSGYAVTRRVSRSGHVSLYNRSYYVGSLHQQRSVYVMLDPDRLEWIFADPQGRHLNQHPCKALTPTAIRKLQVTRRDAVSWRQRRKAH